MKNAIKLLCLLFPFIANAACDVCDVNRIYDSSYQYSLPKTITESYLSGKAFDNPELYSESEALKLREDINEIYQHILSTSPLKECIAIITAGGPGAGKTIKMRQDIENNKALGKIYAYIDPDDVCLKSQTRTYKAQVAGSDGSKEERFAAYNKWRPGSNAATHLILGNLIRDKYGFYFGTTSTGPATAKFFDHLKKQGYQIRLIHVSAPDHVRWESIQERDKTFIQTTEKDVIEKGLLLPQRISDTYLAYADSIEFCYRSTLKEDALLAAKWVRNPEGSKTLGTLHIVDPVRYQKIKALHNSLVETLKRPELLWEETVEKNSTFPASGS